MIHFLAQKLIVLFTPFLAASIAQIIKISINQKGQKLNIKDFLKFTYAGMPSGHSALMVSLATIVGLTEGFSSPIFGACFILAVVIINDAVRLRRYLGQHGEILNILIKDLKNDDVLDKKYPRLLEKIGHTPGQVLAGSLLGLAVACLSYFFVYYL